MGLLAGKVVIVTGAAGGIGAVTSTHLHDEGATVVPTTHSDAGVKRLEGRVTSDRWAPRKLDVTDEQQVAEVVRSTAARFGRIDGMVNNAGVLTPNDAVDATTDEYDRVFDVNVKGVFFGCKYVIPELLRAGGGSIVNFGSINSLAAEKKLSLYTASKGAVLMLTKSVALDFGSQGIRANTVCPAFVDTPLNVPHYTMLGGRAALEEGLPEFQPIGRAIEPIEIAQPVAFLLSDSSTAINGTAFLVDGGALSKA